MMKTIGVSRAAKFMLLAVFAVASAAMLVAFENASSVNAEEKRPSPVELNGRLSVKGRFIVNEQGQPASFAGPSFFWSTTGWGQERFYNADAVKFFAEDWNAGIVRAAMAAEREGSYLTDPEANAERAFTIVDAAIENGLYVVVDWHSHRAEENTAEAIEFFREVATRYGQTPNLIYEIYNEPLDTTDWSTVVKPYAEAVIAEIRKIDPDNLIVVGSQSWDQDLDKVVEDPILGQSNIVYAVHFYAGSHKDDLRAKAQYALDNGLALMATEWGNVNYDGDGPIDRASTLAWMKFFRENDISHMNWAVSDAPESAAMFVKDAPSNGGWTDDELTPSGRLTRDIVRGWKDGTEPKE